MMSRRRRTATTIASRIKRGLGQGEGKDYKPWLTRRNVSSHGRSAHLPVFRHRRHVATLSNHERRVALLLGFDGEVLDIREQYALLPVEGTVELARARGTGHPTKDGFPVERTMDFLVTHARLGLVGLSVKPKERLTKRTLALLELERAYAHMHGWAWALVTEDEIPLVRARNLEILNDNWTIAPHGLASERFDEVADAVERRVRRGATLADACHAADRALGLGAGSALTVSWHRLAHQHWSANLDIPLNPKVLRPCFSPPASSGWVGQLAFL